MQIQESIDRLRSILESADTDDLQEMYPHIAEALDIEVNDELTESDIIDSIVEAVQDTVEESDVENVVEEISQFFDDSEVLDEGKKKKMKEGEHEDDDDDDYDDDDDDDDDDGDDSDDDEDEKDEEYGKGKKKTKKESFFVSANELDVTENVNAMFSGEELTEDFQKKAKTIFESAVVAKVNEKVSAIMEEVDEMIAEKEQELEESYTEKLDEYLTYVVNEWVEENKLSVENGIKNEMTESFMDSLRNVFEDHYIEVPKGRGNLVEELQEKVEKLEGSLNESLDQNAKLQKQLNEGKVYSTLDKLTEGLVETDKEKFLKLIEGIDYNDLDEFKEKAQIIKESYFGSDDDEVQNLTEENSFDDDPIDGYETDDSPMGKLAQDISRFIRN